MQLRAHGEGSAFWRPLTTASWRVHQSALRGLSEHVKTVAFRYPLKTAAGRSQENGEPRPDQKLAELFPPTGSRRTLRAHRGARAFLCALSKGVAFRHPLEAVPERTAGEAVSRG